MESMLDFVSVIIIIFGILQIILFFKLWGMTNNVKHINRKVGRVSGVDLAWEIRKAVLKGDKKKAEDLLLEAFINVMKQKCSEYNEATDEKIAELKFKYEKLYNTIGSELPQSIQNLKTEQDFYNVFTF